MMKPETHFSQDLTFINFKHLIELNQKMNCNNYKKEIKHHLCVFYIHDSSSNPESLRESLGPVKEWNLGKHSTTTFIYYVLHAHDAGKERSTDPCSKEKTHGYYGQTCSQLGWYSEFLILNAFQEIMCRSRNVSTFQGIFIWFPVLSLHSVFLLPFPLVVLTAGVLLMFLTIP